MIGDSNEIMKLADKYRTMNVRTNAETERDAKQAIKFGAEGIGLCRTEHMFFEEDRIKLVRQMILAKDEKGREHCLEKLQKIQKDDLVGIFEVMKERRVNVSLLDHQLHEFLPEKDEQIKQLAKDLKISSEKLKNIIETEKVLKKNCKKIFPNRPVVAAMKNRNSNQRNELLLNEITEILRCKDKGEKIREINKKGRHKTAFFMPAIQAVKASSPSAAETTMCAPCPKSPRNIACASGFSTFC